MSSLQQQTNNASVGLANNWVDVPGSGSITSTNITINPAERKDEGDYSGMQMFMGIFAAGAGLEDEKTKKASIHSFGAHFCEVKIDPLLPRVQVTRWVTVLDVGSVDRHPGTPSVSPGRVIPP